MKKAKTWSTITLAMIPICLAINYVGAQIAIALKLPMYLDVIGSIMSADRSQVLFSAHCPLRLTASVNPLPLPTSLLPWLAAWLLACWVKPDS